MSSIRYSSKIVARAREHRAAKWSYPKVCDLLYAEFGVRPSIESVMRWTNRAHNESWLRINRASKRRVARRARVGLAPRRITDDLALERMRLMRDGGVSFRSIAVVARLWWGSEWSEFQVRGRLLAEPANSGVSAP